MVPPPLSDASSRRISGPFIGGAISSAASPLQASFQLSCRSPLSPARPNLDHGSASTKPPGRGQSSNSYLAPPQRYHPTPGFINPRIALSTAQYEEEETSRLSLAVLSPREDTFSIPPPTPLLIQDREYEDDGKLGVISAINIIIGKTVGVGAYTVPSAIFDGVGSVGMTLSLWIIGSLVSFCGLAVYLDLGTALPRSGGERVYLERIFRRPYMLATFMFMSYVVLLGFSTPNAIVLGEFVLYALDVVPGRWSVRVIAVLAVSALCYIHARHPRLGLRLINVLGVSKLIIIVIVILSGIAGGMIGLGAEQGSALEARRPDPFLIEDVPSSTAQRNFSNIWAGSSMQPYDYATALLKVVYCFRGYSTANQVLSDVKNPVRTLKIAAPAALGIVSLAYLAVNIAFFLVVEKDDFKSSGVVVAGTFFRNIFGETLGTRVLPLFVIISAAGNIAATSFAQARVNEELAKDGFLPFSKFWTSKPPTAEPPHEAIKVEPGAPVKSLVPTSPSRGLLLHWIVSVAVIILPPPGRIYNFLLDIGGYPVSIISVAVSVGLLYLHLSPNENWRSPFPANRIAVVVFAIFNCLLLILPWIPPMDGKGEDARFSWYAYPTTALAVMGSGALYWCWWTYTGKGQASMRRDKRQNKRASGDLARGLLEEDDRELEGIETPAAPEIRQRAACGCPRS